MRFVRPAEALHTLVEACFNFHFIGKERAWKTITELIEKTPVASLEFSDPNSGADACGQILHSV